MLERDYCLAWFLALLSQSDLKTVLGFKGGTALKRCYFGDYRFSEDLDFTLLEAVSLEEILRQLDAVYRSVRDNSGITFAFDREDRQKHLNSYTFYLKYRTAARRERCQGGHHGSRTSGFPPRGAAASPRLRGVC